MGPLANESMIFPINLDVQIKEQLSRWRMSGWLFPADYDGETEVRDRALAVAKKLCHKTCSDYCWAGIMNAGPARLFAF